MAPHSSKTFSFSFTSAKRPHNNIKLHVLIHAKRIPSSTPHPHTVSLMPNKILLGCLIGVLSSATQSIGLTLQRKSHLQQELNYLKASHQHSQPVYKRPLWRLGFSLFLLANLLGSTVQITTLPLIILSPLQAIGLVFNSLCACLLLDEEFSVWSVVSMVSIGIGALFIAYFGSTEVDEDGRELKELLTLLGRDHFVYWLVSSFIVAIALFVYLNVIRLLRKKEGRASLLWCANLGAEDFKMFKGCTYGIISGMLSAHSLLFAKISVEVVINSMKKYDKSLANIRTWFILFSFLSLALIQLFFLNKGLKSISTSILYPLVFCIYNIINITNGLIFYNKLETLTLQSLLMIILGTILVLVGVFSLSLRLKDEKETEAQYAHQNDFDFKSHKTNSTAVLETSSILNEDEEETGYVSFASPLKLNETSPVLQYEPERFDDNRRRTSISRRYSSNISPFKYGSILDDGRRNSGIITRKQRVLSFEQNELLQQLKTEPEV